MTIDRTPKKPQTRIKPPPKRLAKKIAAHLLEGETYGEAANALGITKAKCRSVWQRARATLAEEMEDHPRLKKDLFLERLADLAEASHSTKAGNVEPEWTARGNALTLYFKLRKDLVDRVEVRGNDLEQEVQRIAGLLKQAGKTWGEVAIYLSQLGVAAPTDPPLWWQTL